jgi:hypothetical protein
LTALALGTAAVPTQANALPVWVIRAIIGAGFVGLGAGAAGAHAPPPAAYADPGYPAGTSNCGVVKRQLPSGHWRQRLVCDYG